MLKSIIILIVACFACYPVLAGEDVAAFLEQEDSPKSVALGRAYSVVSESPNAIFTNPAALSQVQSTSFHAGAFQALETSFYQAGIVMPFQSFSLGIGVLAASIDGAHETIYDSATEKYIETGNVFGYQGTAVYVGVAADLFFDVKVGAAVKAVQESLQSNQATGAAVDVGLLYSIENLIPFVSKTTVGASLKNVYSTPIQWDTASKASGRLPFTTTVAINHCFKDGILCVMVAKQDVGQYASTFHGGLEYYYHPVFPVRVGVDDGRISGGVGLILDPLTFDYSMTLPKAREAKILENISRFSVGLSL